LLNGDERLIEQSTNLRLLGLIAERPQRATGGTQKTFTSR
jgi:hypothetical protein